MGLRIEARLLIDLINIVFMIKVLRCLHVLTHYGLLKLDFSLIKGMYHLKIKVLFYLLTSVILIV
jgi:hypothetical protein